MLFRLNMRAPTLRGVCLDELDGLGKRRGVDRRTGDTGACLALIQCWWWAACQDLLCHAHRPIPPLSLGSVGAWPLEHADTLPAHMCRQATVTEFQQKYFTAHMQKPMWDFCNNKWTKVILPADNTKANIKWLQLPVLHKPTLNLVS